MGSEATYISQSPHSGGQEVQRVVAHRPQRLVGHLLRIGGLLASLETHRIINTLTSRSTGHVNMIEAVVVCE